MSMTEERVRELEAHVRRTQIEAWHRLDESIRRASNGVWSMGCHYSATEVLQAARLVGPTSWTSVPWRLVRQGVYGVLLVRIGGLPVALPTAEQLAETDVSFERWSAATGEAAKAWDAEPTISAMLAEADELREDSVAE